MVIFRQLPDFYDNFVNVFKRNIHNICSNDNSYENYLVLYINSYRSNMGTFSTT